MTSHPEGTINRQEVGIKSVAVTTRAGSKRQSSTEINIKSLFDEPKEVVPQHSGKIIYPLQPSSVVDQHNALKGGLNWSRDEVVKLQRQDPKISEIIDSLESNDKLGEQFILKEGLLLKKSFDPSEQVKDRVETYQIVAPEVHHSKVLELARVDKFAGHMSISKTLSRVRRNFYWPCMKSDIVKFCKTCHVCQVMGKPNQGGPKAPLKPIPTLGEPLESIIIDVVGPLPKSKQGSEYLLTIMDRTSRYPDAIPLRRITAKVIVRSLIQFFSRFGMP